MHRLRRLRAIESLTRHRERQVEFAIARTARDLERCTLALDQIEAEHRKAITDAESGLRHPAARASLQYFLDETAARANAARAESAHARRSVEQARHRYANARLERRRIELLVESAEREAKKLQTKRQARRQDDLPHRPRGPIS